MGNLVPLEKKNSMVMRKSMAMRKGMAMKKSMAMRKGMAKKKSRSSVARGKRGKSSVFRGTKTKTSGGLKKSDLTRSKTGKIVSKRASESAKKRFKKNGLDKWLAASKKARKDLKIKGFCPVGGKTQKGKALLAKTRSYYRKS